MFWAAAQWMSSSPVMDHAPLRAVHKTKVQAICTYPEALPLVHARTPNLVLAYNALERLERKKERGTPTHGHRGAGV